MGATSENFCLRWNEFQSNVSSSFRELREEADFFDVTLATSDSGSRTLQAHKVILSACSSFFKQMLRQQTKIQAHPNPLIYLRGVNYADLRSVLDFMYHGEVNVAHNDLNSFLAVAEELQIKGLTNKDNTGSSMPSSNKQMRPMRIRDPGPPAKRIRKSSPGPSVQNHISRTSPVPSTSLVTNVDVDIDEDDDDVKVVEVKPEPEVLMPAAPDETPDENYMESFNEYYEGSGEMEGDGTEQEDGLDGGAVNYEETNDDSSQPDFASTVIAFPDGTGKCQLCNILFKTKENARVHFTRCHLPPEFYECCICRKVVKSKYTFRNHINITHRLKDKNIVEKYGKRVYPKNFT